MKTRVGILGYGNLGRGVELALKKTNDMELAAVFTRRDPASLRIASAVPVVSADDMEAWKDKIDVLILCGGSATDLPAQTPTVSIPTRISRPILSSSMKLQSPAAISR